MLKSQINCVRPWKKLSSKYLNNFCKVFKSFCYLSVDETSNFSGTSGG